MKMSEQADAAGLNPSEGTHAGSNPAPGTTPPDPLEAACIAWYGDELRWRGSYSTTRHKVQKKMRAAIRAYLLARGELEGTGAAWSRALAAELAPAEQEERGEKP